MKLKKGKTRRDGSDIDRRKDQVERYYVRENSSDRHVEKCIEYWRNDYRESFMEYLSEFEDDLFFC